MPAICITRKTTLFLQTFLLRKQNMDTRSATRKQHCQKRAEALYLDIVVDVLETVKLEQLWNMAAYSALRSKAFRYLFLIQMYKRSSFCLFGSSFKSSKKDEGPSCLCFGWICSSYQPCNPLQWGWRRYAIHGIKRDRGQRFSRPIWKVFHSFVFL